MNPVQSSILSLKNQRLQKYRD